MSGCGRVHSAAPGRHLPAYDRDREEMEILSRYIRRDNPDTFTCSCNKMAVDFNCHVVYDAKVRRGEFGDIERAIEN